MRNNPYRAFRAADGEHLSDDEMRIHAPSIYAEKAFPGMSDQYRQVPTIKVVDHLRDHGFLPVQVSQAGTPDRVVSLFAKHAVRFREADRVALKHQGEIVPEVLLRNAHDGSGSYSLMAGLFRVICLNGLIIGEGNVFHLVVRHTGRDDLVDRVLDGTRTLIGTVPQMLERVDRLKAKLLGGNECLDFATKALKLAPTRLTIAPSELLTPRRASDMHYDAWTVMNVVQENLMRGGVPGQDRNGSRRLTTAINDVDRDVKLNQQLWDLAEAA